MLKHFLTKWRLNNYFLLYWVSAKFVMGNWQTPNYFVQQELEFPSAKPKITGKYNGRNQPFRLCDYFIRVLSMLSMWIEFMCIFKIRTFYFFEFTPKAQRKCKGKPTMYSEARNIRNMDTCIFLSVLPLPSALYKAHDYFDSYANTEQIR